MNITYTQNIKECTFEEIKVGECCEYEGKVYLRIPRFSGNFVTINAVSLSNSNWDVLDCLTFISEQTKVYPVFTELKVTYKCEEVK